MVLLDDLVLDVDNFIGQHPGGEEVISRNIGRDISKYYYGGYSMGKGFYAYAHSSSAYMTVKTLAKFRLVPSSFGEDEAAQLFEARLTSRIDAVPGSVHTVTFQAPTAPKGVRKHYSVPNMIGCHYLVQSDVSDKKRHYTVCNVMRNEVYADYSRLIKSVLMGEEPRAKLASLSEEPSNEVCVTLKNYKAKEGVATRIST